MKKEKVFGINKNFLYGGVEYDYETQYHCHEDENDCGCDCICRCSTIEYAKVTSVDVGCIAKDLPLGKKNITEVEKYCVERILRINKIWEFHNWYISIGGGYYGEEVDGVIYDDPKSAKKINEQLKEMLSIKTPSDKIFYILELEYGYILEALQGKRFRIVNIKKSDLSFQNDHYTHLDMDAVASYASWDLPRGICTKQDKKYRLIDGYHRVGAIGHDKPFKIYLAY